MKYRPEIDGLRALAVLPVLLFHAGFSLFSGGYVGVDVFFVISGYLITTILINDLENNRFSILNFYERRARRILPALTFMMLICIPFAWNWMLPYQTDVFAKSLIYVSLFASNIFFWRTGGDGYFTPNTEEIPLLHTWSLGIEEQYYLLFPIFLLLTWRFGKKRIFWMLVMVGILSLGISEWGWRNERIANFYLTPTRAWELISGSIAAFIIIKRGVQTNNTLSLIGLAAILFSIFAYDNNTPFPSIYTLAPVLGVVLIILFADKQTFVAKVLSTKLLVGIGLISYSTYLWHQPLFVFARLRLLDPPSISLYLVLSITSLLLGFLSWRFIERPFRNKNFLTRDKIFVYSILALLIPIIIGKAIQNNSDYFLYQITEDGKPYKYYGYDNYNDPRNAPIGYISCKGGFNITPECGFRDFNDDGNLSANNIVWGDSYAQHAIEFVQLNEEGSTAQISLPSCPPFLSQLEMPDSSRGANSIVECQLFNQKAQEYIRNNGSINNLIISSRFYYVKNLSNDEIIKTARYFKEQLDNYLKTFSRQINVKIFPPPYTPPYDPSSCVNKILVHGYKTYDCDFQIDNLSNLSNKQNLFINELKKMGLSIYPLNELICKDGIKCSAFIDSVRIHRDNTGHLTNISSKYLGNKLREQRNLHLD
ncbi:acyltransferase family protein [Pseudothioglobus sp. nBUS_23]|uniref:acyltransferase family protein n=1 Tax=Pseudothioglobus sp. nBUS_23 TaxID=3395318 RepID=UPI003EB7881F